MPANTDSLRAIEVRGLHEGRYIIQALALGYSTRSDTLYLAAGTRTAVTVTLFPWLSGVRCSPPRFRRPGQTACVAPDHSLIQLYRRVAVRFADPRQDPLAGLDRFLPEEIVVVTDEAVCERASREYGGKGSPPRRVIVLRLGNAGYLVYDPFEPNRGGEFTETVIYNPRWQVLARLEG